MNFEKQIHWLIYPLFFLACARQTAPTGGPKDTIPPILIKANPTNGQTNYTGSTLELTFNEMLLLNNPKEQIIITPEIGKEFDVETKKNKLILTFKNSLSQNTTYSANFREAVQDITEKNPTENLKIAFSTGDYIDSLSIAGTVYDLLKYTESKDATVALFQTDTFNIFEHKPTYFTKTDKEGKFILTNLKPGAYYVYAMNDKNKNLTIESRSESYGFKSTSLQLNTNVDTIGIPLINLDARPLKLTSARPSGAYFNIKTSKSLADYTIESTNATDVVSSFGDDAANIRIYNTFKNVDSLQIHLVAHDSIQNNIDTTLYVKFSTRQLQPDDFKTTNAGFRVLGPKGQITGRINFTKPLHEINYDSIYYQIDSATRIPITPQDIQIDSPHNTLTIKKLFDPALLAKPAPTDQTTNTKFTQQSTQIAIAANTPQPKPTNKPYQLYIAPKSLISIDYDSSQLMSDIIKPTTPQTTGTIIVRVETEQPNFIVQLLTTDFKIVDATINNSLTAFEDLDPKTYQIRLIIDYNNDKKWSPGNFFANQEPEPVIFYRNEKQETSVNLKANWELGPLLITF